MDNSIIFMEDYFQPGFKTTPALHIGSQTHPLFHGDPEEQAWESTFLAAVTGSNTGVGRNIDQDYITYWESLMGKANIINLQGTNKGKFLTEVILENPKIIERIMQTLAPGSTLMVLLPTILEQRLAIELGIPLHGSVKISETYGTKSGTRIIAKEANIPMTPGFVCKTISEVNASVARLSRKFSMIVIKYNTSLSGCFTKKLSTKSRIDIPGVLNTIAGGKFVEGKDIVVVEGWVKNKASLCAHIEILKGQEPIICAGWQQVIDNDGITYIGGGPLQLSKKAMRSFLDQTTTLAKALKDKGAVGSFGPDFLVTEDDEIEFEPDSCILVELNARVPYTAYPLEIVKQVRGKIGTGFLSRHIKLSSKVSFSVVHDTLKKHDLLVTDKHPHAKGVVPYSIGLLPYKLFDIVAMADSWEETKNIAQKVETIFSSINKA